MQRWITRPVVIPAVIALAIIVLAIYRALS
jgi:hypothetical protein